MDKVKIGFLPLYVKLYDDGSPQIRPRIDAFAQTIADRLRARPDVELIQGDVCRLHAEFEKAVSAAVSGRKIEAVLPVDRPPHGQ